MDNTKKSRVMKTYRLKESTLYYIEHLRLMLDLSNDTEVIEKAVRFYYQYAKTFTNTTTGQDVRELFDMITND